MTTFKTRNIPAPSEPRGTLYSRFIPREELSSFAAWRPDDLAGGRVASAPAKRAADETPTVDVAEQIAAQMRAARQGGYQDGYRDGLVALEGFKQSFASQSSARIGELVQSLGQEFADLRQEMAQSLAVAATHLARQIVRSELATTPALIAGVAQEALDAMLLNAQHITLRVHPDDTLLVAQGAAEVLAARGARLLGDASLSRGSCLVESNIGLVDASIETRWRRAVASLGCDEPWAPIQSTDEPPSGDA